MTSGDRQDKGRPKMEFPVAKNVSSAMESQSVVSVHVRFPYNVFI